MPFSAKTGLRLLLFFVGFTLVWAGAAVRGQDDLTTGTWLYIAGGTLVVVDMLWLLMSAMRGRRAMSLEEVAVGGGLLFFIGLMLVLGGTAWFYAAGGTLMVVALLWLLGWVTWGRRGRSGRRSG